MWRSQGLCCPQGSGHVVTRPRLLLATRLRVQGTQPPAPQRISGCAAGASTPTPHPVAHDQTSRQGSQALKQIRTAVSTSLHRWHVSKLKQASPDVQNVAGVASSNSPLFRYVGGPLLCPHRTVLSTVANHQFLRLVSCCRKSTKAAKLCVLFGVAVLPGSGFAELGKNYVFMAGFWGWFLAQGCKVRFSDCKPFQAEYAEASFDRPLKLQIFSKRWRKGVWDLKAIVDSGGMPSSHSALCSVSAPTWLNRLSLLVTEAVNVLSEA